VRKKGCTLAKTRRRKGLSLYASAPLRAKKTNNSHQSAKSFPKFFAAFLLGEKKKKLARKDAKTQRFFFFAPLRAKKLILTQSLPTAGFA